MDALAGETVAPRPVGALRAGFSLGVVDAFFVRAADEAIGDDHGLGGVLFEEGDNVLANGEVVAYVGIFGKPAFEWIRLVTLAAHDADNDLRGKSGCWPIESDSSDRVALKALLGLAWPCLAFLRNHGDDGFQFFPTGVLFGERAQYRGEDI